EGSARQEMVAQFMKKYGCVKNELGFSTCHLAVETADIPRNVAFYNNVLGWPLYKTIDRAHAGASESTYGSSWASYGAFASFVVFHEGRVPIGAQGHGPWSSAHDCPAPLRKSGQGGSVGSISFKEIPAGFLGCILEPGFFQKQMARIAEKDASVKWLDVTDVRERFGGGEIDSAVCFKDPDGYPLVFFVARRKGEAYKERFPAVPFVYSAHFRVSPDYRTDVSLIPRKITKDMLAQLMSDQLDATKAFYKDILDCKPLFEAEWGGRQRLEFEWEGHFICLKSDPEHVPPSLREDRPGNSGHNMGGNKGRIPVPHFDPNTT
ncbi:MAG TPA: VOC family protein, partial [Usitatibacter sp.]